MPHPNLSRRSLSTNDSPQESEYDPKVFLEQFSLAKRFVYHLTYYRVLHAAYTQNKIKSEFWTHTIDAHLVQASVVWCMVFGSHGCNPTHWKKLSNTQSKEIENRFRGGLTKSSGVRARQLMKH